MGEVLDRAFTEQRLLEAWTEVRDAALADGDAGPDVERFEKTAARGISELAAALAGGTFEPHPVVRVEIAKPGGGVRKLASYTRNTLVRSDRQRCGAPIRAGSKPPDLAAYSPRSRIPAAAVG